MGHMLEKRKKIFEDVSDQRSVKNIYKCFIN
jgi:hypothetical protein